MRRSRRAEGLSLGYRIRYRVRMVVLNLYGPAQLGDQNDPVMRLKREREARVAAARQARRRPEWISGGVTSRTSGTAVEARLTGRGHLRLPFPLEAHHGIVLVTQLRRSVQVQHDQPNPVHDPVPEREAFRPS